MICGFNAEVLCTGRVALDAKEAVDAAEPVTLELAVPFPNASCAGSESEDSLT